MSIPELQKIIISNTPYTDYINTIYDRISHQEYHTYANIYPVLVQGITRYFDTINTVTETTKQQLLQLIEILVTTYKNITYNSGTADIIHTILTKYNKTDHTHLKLINILLPYFPDTNIIIAHLPYEIEPQYGNTYTVNYLYYMGIRPNPTQASVLNVKLIEVFINHMHNILGPINVIQGQPTSTPTTSLSDNLLALSIRTHNMNILYPTNISYHITKYLIYHIAQNKIGPITQYLDNAPNPFIIGLITLKIRYTVTQENHIFNFILLINYIAKIYDLITTEPDLFKYLTIPFNTRTFNHSFHSLLHAMDVIPFLINSQKHQFIKECRAESYFPGIYNRQELLDYFIEFINTEGCMPPKKKTNAYQHLTD